MFYHQRFTRIYVLSHDYWRKTQKSFWNSLYVQDEGEERSDVGGTRPQTGLWNTRGDEVRINLSIYQSINLSIYQSINLSFSYLFLCPSTRPPIKFKLQFRKCAKILLQSGTTKVSLILQGEKKKTF